MTLAGTAIAPALYCRSDLAILALHSYLGSYLQPRVTPRVEGSAALSTPTPPYTTGTLTSADGTTIGYRKLGGGPGVVLLSAGFLAAQHYMGLAEALSDAFTVYVMDRRGRELSRPPGDRYSMARECEDVEALLAATGARLVFGHSSGALVALRAVLTLPQVDKIAVYERRCAPHTGVAALTRGARLRAPGACRAYRAEAAYVDV
jgi:pimeloyl-ACP methyl ester carboxylesterase